MTPMHKLFCKVATVLALMAATACHSSPLLRITGKIPAEMYDDPKVVALVEAIVDQDARRVSKLAKQGANVNESPKDGAVPLLWASYARCNPCIEALLKAGADPWLKMENPGKSAIEMIVDSGDRPDQLPLFLKAGLDPNHPVSNPRDVSLLGIAAFNGPLESVKQLVDAGADVNFHGAFYSEDAVGQALGGGRFDAVLFLLEKGYKADLNELALGVQTRKVDLAHESERQQVIGWLKERGVQYPPDANSDP